MKPRDFVADFIKTHEGGLSMDPADRGNYVYLRNGQKRLVGSKYGVTGAALANYRRIDDDTVTKQHIAALTFAEAVDIAIEDYYEEPRFDRLPWNPVTASVFDMGYNAGPKVAAMLLQQMIGVGDDGSIGPRTCRAYDEYLDSHGVDAAARAYCAERLEEYEAIIQRRPVNMKYRAGWRNRAQSFLPGTPWWSKWR